MKTHFSKKHLAFTVLLAALGVAGQAQNIGIGTSTPAARLHVAGTLRVDGASIFNEKVGIGTFNDALTVPLTVQSMNYSTTSLQTLAEFKSLALGSPIQIRVKHADENRAAVLGTNETGAYVGVHGSSRFDIRQGNEVRMTFEPNGRVGIGVASPRALLDITGNLAIGFAPSVAISPAANGLLVQGPIITGSTGNNSGVQLDVNGAMALRSATIQIATIQTTLPAGNRSFLRLVNGIGWPTVITMEPGIADGQVLIILADVIASNSPIVFLNSAFNRTQLSTDFQMGTDDTLTLVWSEVRQRWIELSRSVN